MGESKERKRNARSDQARAVGQIHALREDRDYDGDQQQERRVLNGQFHERWETFLKALLSLALVSAWTVPTFAQSAAEPSPIRVDVDLVNVLCTVSDKHGALVTNLGKDDFEIREDGKKQEIRY